MLQQEEETKNKSKSKSKILDFIFSLSATTVLVGAIQDIVSAGRDWGYLAPIFFFSLIIILLLIGLVPSINAALKNHFRYWKKGIIFGLLIVTLTTGLIAYYSSKTENGLIVEAVPDLIKIQELLNLTNNKLEKIDDLTQKIESEVSLQNLSFEGSLLNLNPKTSDDFLKNGFILFKNNNLKAARLSLEKYILKTNKLHIDAGELFYLILKKEGINAKNHLKRYIDKHPEILFTIFKHSKLTIKNIDKLTNLSIENPSNLPIKFLLAQSYWDLKLTLPLKMIFYQDEIWDELRKTSIEQIESYFYGYPLKFDNLSASEWKEHISNFFPISYKYYQPTEKQYIENFVGLKLNDQNKKICLYKNDLGDNGTGNIKTTFEITSLEQKKSINKIADVNFLSGKLCSADITSLINFKAEKNTLEIYYVDYDGLRYGPWKFVINGINNWTYSDYLQMDQKINKKFIGSK